MGSRQLFFDERVYPSPRASTDPGACYSDSTTLSSQDLGCDEFFAGSTLSNQVDFDDAFAPVARMESV